MMNQRNVVESAAWFAIDWGSTRMRAWAVDADDGVIGARASDDGLRSAAEVGFEATLRRRIGDWLTAAPTAPLLLSGMAGARGGWREAPYAACPATLASVIDAAKVFEAFDRPVRILPGVRRVGDHDMADVMRGEEIQVFGAAALLGRRDAVVRAPGTHSKWTLVADGSIQAFKTYATGEMFALLRGRSLMGALAEGDGFDPSGFDRGVDHGAREPLSHALFAARAEVVTGALAPAAASAFLSGVLIGAELADPTLDAAGSEILIADGEIRRRYLRAAERLGRSLEPIAAEAATLAGLKAAASVLFRG